MLHADVLTLIAETPDAHGVFATKTETKRNVLCTVRSVTRNEAYTAMGHGLRPDWIFILSHAFEYAGERNCEFHGVRYRVIRTYVTEVDGIELTCERVNEEDNAYV